MRCWAKRHEIPLWCTGHLIAVDCADERGHGWWCALNSVLEQSQELRRGSIPQSGASLGFIIFTPYVCFFPLCYEEGIF